MKKIIVWALMIVILFPIIGTAESSIPPTNWEITYFVDGFGDPTDEPYIRNKSYFTGRFSNSATTDSDLYVGMIISQSEVSFKLIEYGAYVVKPKSYEKYKMLVKNPDGKVFSFELKSQYTDRVSIANADDAYLFGEQQGKYDYLKVSIVETKYGSSYNFQFSTNPKRLIECFKEIGLIESD